MPRYPIGRCPYTVVRKIRGNPRWNTKNRPSHDPSNGHEGERDIHSRSHRRHIRSLKVAGSGTTSLVSEAPTPRAGTHATPRYPRHGKAPTPRVGTHAAPRHPRHGKAPTPREGPPRPRRRKHQTGLDGPTSTTRLPPPRSEWCLKCLAPIAVSPGPSRPLATPKHTPLVRQGEVQKLCT